MTSVVYACVHLNRRAELQSNLRHHAPFVDRMIVSDGGSTDGSIEWLQSDECKKMNVELVIQKQQRLPYGNHTPDARNPYLKKLKIGVDDWLLVMDTDEFLEQGAGSKLRYFAQRAEAAGYDEVRFQARDIWTYETGEVYDNFANYWKENMFVKIYPNMEYMGDTHSGIWRPGAKNRFAKSKIPVAGGESRYLHYEHRKTERMMWRNSTFLYWTTCGVAQNRTDKQEQTPEAKLWREFHDLVEKHHFYDWHEFNRYMEAGNIAQEIKDWFIANRNNDNPEVCAFFVWYFVFLRPQENVQKINCEKHNRYTWDYLEVAKQKRANQ